MTAYWTRKNREPRMLTPPGAPNRKSLNRAGFFNLDSDQDGKLSLSELKRWFLLLSILGIEPPFGRGYPSPPAWQADELLRDCDANHNGTLEGDEVFVLYARVVAGGGARRAGSR